MYLKIDKRKSWEQKKEINLILEVLQTAQKSEKNKLKKANKKGKSGIVLLFKNKSLFKRIFQKISVFIFESKSKPAPGFYDDLDDELSFELIALKIGESVSNFFTKFLNSRIGKKIIK